MKNLILILATLMSTSAFAVTAFDRNGGPGDLKPNQFKAGIQAGQVGLLGDQGGNASNAIGIGLVGNYSITDALTLELTYLQSSKDELDHKEYAFGIMNYFNSYESMMFHWATGIAFANNSFDVANQSLSDTGFGLYAGIGMDVLTKGRVTFGVQGRYYKMFDASKTASNGTEYKIVDDFYTVLFRVMYAF
jgi:hypothetical protein